MNGIIIYSSKYNTTKEYGQWISEETNFESISLKDFNLKDLENKDLVIIGSPVMAFQPKLSKWIEKNWNSLKDKKVYLYTTSGAPSTDPALVKAFVNSVPQEIGREVTYFPFSGRMIYSKLSVMDKLLMKIGQLIEKDPVIKEEMIKDVDGVNREEIFSLIEDVNLHMVNSKIA